MSDASYAIKQGDAYALPIRVSIDGEAISERDLLLIESVEFMVSEDIRKVYPDDVVFDSANGVFLVPVTQAETFTLEDGDTIRVDVRVEFSGGDVIGTHTMEQLRVLDALSEEEL